MKKLTILLLLILLVSVFVVPTAFASDSEYLKVKNSTTIFFSSSYEPLFLLTQNCYVKYLNFSGEYIEVEYHGIKGYVNAKSIGVTINDVSSKTVSGLSYYYHTAQQAKISVDTFLLSKPGMGAISLANISKDTLVFPIGKYTDGTVEYVYVKYGDTQTGAIKASHLEWDGIITPPSNVSTNPSNPTPPPTGGSTDTGADNTNNGTDLTPDTKDPENNLVRVLLIIGICVPALIIVYLIFKPVKPSSNRYASENPRRRDDFEDFE